MRFLTFEQAQREPYVAQYRHSTVMALLGLLIVMCAMGVCGVFAYMAWMENKTLGLVVTGWIELWGLLFALMIGGTIRKRMLPSNWLVRLHASGISIKFRTYLNTHFDEGDPVVAFIPYPEIEYARVHRVRQDVPGSTRDETEMRFLRFAEFKLRDEEDLQHLDEQLAAERARKGPTRGRFVRRRSKRGDYPVRVADGFLRIQWQVFPRLWQFMKDLSGHLEVRETNKSKVDFSHLESATSHDQKDALRKLIGAGDTFGAMRIIKELYGYNTTRARQFLDELKKEKKV
jgi:hypothetical protein